MLRTKVIRNMCDVGWIREDVSRIVFEALSKKSGANECDLKRTITIMNRVTKLIRSIVMKRFRSIIRSETGHEQWSFVLDTGTRNRVFMYRIWTEWTKEVQNDIYISSSGLHKGFQQRKTRWSRSNRGRNIRNKEYIF